METKVLPPKGLTPWEWRSRITDAVLSSFSLYGREHSIPERVQTDKVYQAFYELKAKYPEWLGNLNFEKGYNMFVSKQLEDVFFSLGAFRLMTVENHDYRYLKIDKLTKAQIKKSVKGRVSSKDIRILRRLSNDFASIVAPK